MMIHSGGGYDINELYSEAKYRWLKPAELLYILQNHEMLEITEQLPQKPSSGSLLLYNKRVIRYFRSKDGHSWRKKRNGRTVGEAHERLKVGNAEVLNCYYAHGEHNPNFRRRSYWILDPAYEHIVLVHYRDITEGRASSGSISQLSLGATSSIAQTPISNTPRYLGSTSINEDLYGKYKKKCSPGSVEVNSQVITENVEMNHLDSANGTELCSSVESDKSLEKLEQKLSPNDDSFVEIGPFCSQDININNSQVLEHEGETANQNEHVFSLDRLDYPADNLNYGRYLGMRDNVENQALHKDKGIGYCHNQSFRYEHTNGSNETISWSSSMHGSWKNASTIQQEENLLSTLSSGSLEEHANQHWSNINEYNAEKIPEVGNVEITPHASIVGPQDTNMGYYTTPFDQSQMGMPLEEGPCLNIAQKQKFRIHEVSPEWGFTTEPTKIIIIGSFLCDPSEFAWTCMFGDIEVPLQIIQEGVLRCEAPPQAPGKVTLCITSGNRESCSEIREFEYRTMTSNCVHGNWPPGEATWSTEELLLLVRFIQMLLSDPSEQTRDGTESGIHMLREQKADDDSWSHIIDDLLAGTGTSSSTIDWLLQELMKDKLQQWFSLKSERSSAQSGCALSKKEQGIIHMVAGLGFEWALNSVLNSGVNINFRDINGWTALHWAARFGREDMVAALIASGADAWAVTDPTSQDPTGKTPASVAASSGHKGLAGYLSEVALTGHLSSLTLEENEVSKGTAAVQAEITVNSISKATLAHQSSLKDTLEGVRNAAEAAARIQSAFRVHSFRKRQQQEEAAAALAYSKAIDEYGFDSVDMKGLPAMSKVSLGKARDYFSAALSIQKKYRGWKGRRDFLALRQKVVTIQAHVRGYQIRKQYKVICWAVGVLEKGILRWRRKAVGLRGFRQDLDLTNESEDEDIAKLFRKQKLDAAIDDALSRVLRMVDNPEARKQYCRMLERYRQAKAELAVTSEAAVSNSQGGVTDMDKEEFHANSSCH